MNKQPRRVRAGTTPPDDDPQPCATAVVNAAAAVALVASVLVDTARVEVDYLKATHAEHSDFLASPTGHVQRIDAAPTAHNPFPASVRHRLQG